MPRLVHVAQEGSRLPARPGALGSLTRVAHELTVRLGRRAPLTVFSTAVPGDGPEELVDGVRHVRFAPGLDHRVLSEWYRWRNRLGRRIGLCERPLPANPLYFRGWIGRVAGAIRGQHADVVHLHNVSQFVPPLRRAAPQARLVLQMHCEWLVELPRAVVARRLASVDLVLGVSRHVAGQVAGAHPELADRCRVLPNGVDPRAFPPRETVTVARAPEVNALRSRLGLRGPVVLYVGRLSSEKGVHVLLEAFGRVRARHPEARCLIVGPDWGPIRKVRAPGGSAIGDDIALLDRSYMTRLRDLAAPHGDRVVFAGPVPNDGLPVWYAAADVLAVPSLVEAFGIPALEAAASGLPIVAAATGGLLDTVDESTGVLVPPRDAGALGDALAHLLADPGRRHALGRAGRDRVLARFTWDAVVDRLAAYYDHILTRPETSSRTGADGERETSRDHADGVPRPAKPARQTLRNVD